MVFMNMINSEYIKSYCLNKFKDNYRLSSDETELIIPSIFIEEDTNRHMSINLETGLWQCFKSGERGNFIKLYSITEKIPYRKAYEKFLFEAFMAEPRKEVKPEEKIESLDDTTKFEFLDIYREYTDPLMSKAAMYVIDRGLDNGTFYVAKDGFYANRLIIPFFNMNKEMFYFQARALLDGMQPKYLNCKSLKSSEVLFPFKYTETSPLFITEGVFDCLALSKCGYNSTTTLSCNVGESQMSQLKFYSGPIVVAYDSDRAGIEGVHRFLRIGLKHKLMDMWWVTPSKGFKDWNEQVLKNGVLDTSVYIGKNITKLDSLHLAVSGL